MNTNNRQQNNNNRRRGRNNNNRQQNNNRSGFDYQNQIDNRARGNAAQMLEKYKKLAQDAQFNGDRVNAEYHLQFADHYFRVLADFRSRQEARTEQQGQRPNRDEWREENRDGGYEDSETGEDSDNYTQAETAVESNDEESRRESRDNRPRRNDRNERGPRPERDGNRAPRRHHSEEVAEEAATGIDLSVLPPSIATASNDEGDVDFEDKPVRKPRARKPRVANDDETATAAE
jgi:hypothetical protein